MSDSGPEIRNDLSILGWADTPWIVAALLGVWGVMIGIEEFFLADVFMVLAGAFCTWRLAADCFQNRRRRWLPFCLWLALIVAFVAMDFYLTAQKKASAEQEAKEIPALQRQITTLQKTIRDQSSKLNQAQGRMDQHVTDIQQENRELKRSIEQKDAALVSIAKQQYSLNFVPHIVVDVHADAKQIIMQNLGKTNVRFESLEMSGKPQDVRSFPLEVAPSAWEGFKVTDEEETQIVADATFYRAANDHRTYVDLKLFIHAQDGKRYIVPFTWVFIIEKGAISKSFAIDRPLIFSN